MKILFVHPEFPTTYWGFQASVRIAGKRAALPPLGLVSMAAVLPAAWRLRLVDTNVEPLRDADIAWADVVLLGGMLVQVPSMLAVLSRARSGGKRTIVGGPAATTSPELFERADHVFMGEAEGRGEELVAAIEGRLGTRRLRSAGDAKPDMALAPLPRFDLLDIAKYRSMSVQYSRGCPYHCEFCDIIEIFGRRPRVKSPEQVLAELEAIHALGFRGQLFFVDDNFIGNRREVARLLPRLERWQRERGFPFALYTEASINLASDPALMKAMVDAGFTSVFVGIESPSQEALADARKTHNVGVDLRGAIDTLTRAGLAVMGGFIVGFDADGPDTFEAQRAFIDSVPVPLAMVGILSALPGTALSRRLAREGRLRSASSGDQFSRPNFESTMGDEALMRGYAALLADIYSEDAYYRRAAALVDRLGPPARAGLPVKGDLWVALRAVVLVGLRGPRRGSFWRLVARGARRGAHGVTVAITHAVMAEHLIRYTQTHVVPRLHAELRVPRPVAFVAGSERAASNAALS